MPSSGSDQTARLVGVRFGFLFKALGGSYVVIRLVLDQWRRARSWWVPDR